VNSRDLTGVASGVGSDCVSKRCFRGVWGVATVMACCSASSVLRRLVAGAVASSFSDASQSDPDSERACFFSEGFGCEVMGKVGF